MPAQAKRVIGRDATSTSSPHVVQPRQGLVSHSYQCLALPVIADYICGVLAGLSVPGWAALSAVRGE